MIARDRSPLFAGLMCLGVALWLVFPHAVGWPKDAMDWLFQIARTLVAVQVCISIWRDRA